MIGVVLGALGSGGAILALPVLVYAAGLPPKQAVGVSQLVVGFAAMVGSLLQMRRGTVAWPHALWFGLAGIPATKLGALLNARMDARVLMLLFAGVVAMAGVRMLRTAHEESKGSLRIWVAIPIGLAVGLLTGLLGVGGGFLLVPALIAFGGLEARQATATSLPVIAVNSIAGAAGQSAQWMPVLSLALAFLAATLAGTFLGLRAAAEASEAKLKQSLGVVLLAVGAGVGAMNAWSR
jgi:uncharacterized protein